MDMKRLVTGAVVGGIVLMILGYLFYELLLADFFASNSNPAAAGLEREAPIFWALFIGEISMAVLVTMALGWTGGSSTADGFKTGATIGFLAGVTINFIMYGIFDIWNLTASIVDPIVALIRVGIAGAAIAMVLGKMGGSASSAPSM